MSGAAFWAGKGGNLGKLWKDYLQTTKTGSPIPNLFNALLALRNDPEWHGKLRYDEMLCAIVNPSQPIEDPNVFIIHEWMQTHGLNRMSLEAVREAVEIVGREHPFHPIREWLKGLAWDGRYRLADWLHTYLGTDNDEYHRQIGANFLKAMVARIFEPGCKADYMLVLEGPQGTLKSQACRALAGEYFSDAMPDLGSDHIRVQMHLRGKWLIEVSELSSFSRADSAKLKAFLTTAIEPYTPKFARHEVREPRQCVFVGTTNKDTYLRDETGSRRFWPVKCGKIDLDGLKQVREQLFAEAVREYRKKPQWWPDQTTEDQVIKDVQKQRYQGDAWETLIEDWDRCDADRDSNGRPIYLTNGNGDKEPAPRRAVNGPPYYLIDIAKGALRLDRMAKAEEMRLATVLESLGWERADKTRRGRPWIPPPSL